MASGSTRRRGEGWELRVYAGLHPLAGKRRYVTKTVQKEASAKPAGRFVAWVGERDTDFALYLRLVAPKPTQGTQWRSTPSSAAVSTGHEPPRDLQPCSDRPLQGGVQHAVAQSEIAHLDHDRRHALVAALAVDLAAAYVATFAGPNRDAATVDTRDPAGAFYRQEQLSESGFVWSDDAPGIKDDAVHVGFTVPVADRHAKGTDARKGGDG
ncbi:MAG: hypothetical protein NVS3B12_07460 [Acidimicrobiales bacterium]